MTLNRTVLKKVLVGLCFPLLLFLLILSDSLTVRERIETRQQSDEALSEYIKQYFLIPPSDKPYVEPPKSASYRTYRHSQYNVESLQRILFKGKKQGVFFEAGAHDGIKLSNTLFLERFYNWTGLLVEGDPEALVKLKAAKRRAWVAPVLLSTTKNPAKLLFNKFGVFSYIQPLGDIVRSYDCGGKRPLFNVSDVILKTLPAKCRPVDNREEVWSIPLYALLKASGFTTIDFFSLDVEGVEMSVLKTIPFDQVNIKVFVIEANHLDKDELNQFMTSKGYEKVDKVGSFNMTKTMPIDLLYIKTDSGLL